MNTRIFYARQSINHAYSTRIFQEFIFLQCDVTKLLGAVVWLCYLPLKGVKHPTGITAKVKETSKTILR